MSETSDIQESKVQYVVRDRSAERGITINNVLLAIVILGGGVFGTVVTSYMSHLTNSVAKMEASLSIMQTADGVTANELSHLNTRLKSIEAFHMGCAERLRKVEGELYRRDPK